MSSAFPKTYIKTYDSAYLVTLIDPQMQKLVILVAILENMLADLHFWRENSKILHEAFFPPKEPF